MMRPDTTTVKVRTFIPLTSLHLVRGINGINGILAFVIDIFFTKENMTEPFIEYDEDQSFNNSNEWYSSLLKNLPQEDDDVLDYEVSEELALKTKQMDMKKMEIMSRKVEGLEEKIEKQIVPRMTAFEEGVKDMFKSFAGQHDNVLRFCKNNSKMLNMVYEKECKEISHKLAALDSFIKKRARKSKGGKAPVKIFKKNFLKYAKDVRRVTIDDYEVAKLMMTMGHKKVRLSLGYFFLDLTLLS